MNTNVLEMNHHSNNVTLSWIVTMFKEEEENIYVYALFYSQCLFSAIKDIKPQFSSKQMRYQIEFTSCTTIFLINLLIQFLFFNT